MADIKISELTAVSTLNNGDLVEVSQVNELAPSGYTSLKATMADIGKKVNTDIEYTTDLADFTDKTTLGAIKETAKGKNLADEYDGTQTCNKGDVVIYKNTLYICQDDNVTGTWDSTKWLATTVDDLIPKTDNNLPHYTGTPTAGTTAGAIGDLTQLTTTGKSSLVGAVNEVNGNAVKSTSAKPLFKSLRTSSITVTVGANAYSTITANDVIGAITGGIPSGYIIIAITRFYQTDDICYLIGYDPTATGTGAFAYYKNPTGTAKTRNIIFDLLCVNSDYI